MDFNKLLSILKESGIVGAGGAGFPSYAKLNTKADTIILNCAECEPLLKLHRQVMAEYASEILEAMHIVATAVGADDMIIAIKPNYTSAVEAIKQVLPEYQDKNARIGFLPQVYPAGDEVITIYETTGRIVPPGKLPIEVGCIVFNVETMLNIYYAVKQNKPVTHKYCTITGAVEKPVTLLLPLGITVKDAISYAGKITCDDYEIICGGPMTGSLCSEYDVVTKTSNAYIVLPKGHYVVQKKKTLAPISVKRAMSSCCHCGMCTELCSRNLLGYPIDPSRFMTALSAGATENVKPYVDTFYCSSCGLCEMYSCFQSLSARSLISVFKGGMRKGGVTMPPAEATGVNPNRAHKQVSHSRLTARLGLAQYNHSAPITDVEFNQKSVKILLSQHIGAPSEAIVKVGDNVVAGQVIAVSAQDKLGVNIHSSVNGTVSEVTQRYVKISKGN